MKYLVVITYLIMLPSIVLASECNNGIVEEGESCDETDLNGSTCLSEGFASGILSCNNDCTLNVSQCNEETLIDNPGIYPNEKIITSENYYNMHLNAESVHALPKIITLNSSNLNYTTNGSWPNGTYERAYFSETYDFFNIPHSNGNYWGTHPLVRWSAIFGEGYILMDYYLSSISLGKQRINEIMEHFKNVEQIKNPAENAGSFVAWLWRPDIEQPNIDQNISVLTPGPDNRVFSNWYSAGLALAFMSRAYWLDYQNTGIYPNNYFEEPIRLTADWFLNETYGLSDGHTPNVNYHGFAAYGTSRRWTR